MTAPLLDRNGAEIRPGDFVSLDGNMTADDPMGALPNGWIFDESDVYQVAYDEQGGWSLLLSVDPDTPENVKWIKHAVSLLRDGLVELVRERRQASGPQLPCEIHGRAFLYPRTDNPKCAWCEVIAKAKEKTT